MRINLFILTLFAPFFFSCAKLDRLSDANTVTSFRATSHKSEIVIEEARIEGDTIFIPILYGKYAFPMPFAATVTTSPDINKIVGVDFSKELEFEHIGSQIKFHVVAQSGATRTYYIRPKEIPLDENNYIYGNVSFTSVVPSGSVLSSVAHRDFEEGNLRLYGVELNYPVTVAPVFSIEPTAHFGDIWLEGESAVSPYREGTALTFDNDKTTYCLKVVSQSGLVKVWKISLQSCVLIDGDDPLAKNLHLDPRSVLVSSSQSGLTINETRVDNSNGSIMVLTEKSNVRPLSLTVNIPASELADMIYIKRDTVFTFDNYDETKIFYMLDYYDGVAQQWTVSLKEERSNQAQVLSFRYGYEAGLISAIPGGQPATPSIVMDLSKVYISPQEREITLIYQSYQVDINAANPNWWRCTLKDIEITLSEGATCTMPTIEWKATAGGQAAGLLGQPRTFDITAEDGTTSTWSIKLMPADGFSLSSECRIKAMTIDRVIPNTTKFDINPVDINETTKKIVLKLKEDDIYPIQVFPGYVISNYASVASQSGGTQPLVFDNPGSEQLVAIMAQDGTTQTYTVSLLSPPKSAAAEITGITFGTLSPSGFSMAKNATIDPQSATITLHVVSDDASFKLTVPYSNITVSEKATLSISAERGNLVFNNSTDVVSIVVTAQNKSTKTWQLKLDYRPQLTNWNLNAWSGNNPTPSKYWATANMTVIIPITGTTSGTGSSGLTGDKAAVMTTKKAPIVNTLAAGTLFNGYFDSSNPTAGLSDPVKLTFFGIPFAPTAKIKGVRFDVSYHPNTVDKDWGSAAINLIYWDGKKAYVYHGDKPNNSSDPKSGASPHSENTAVLAASGQMRFGTGKSTTEYGDPVKVLRDRQWETVFIPVDGSVPFNYISLVFSSSCYGDYFKGESGSELKVDNITIVYEGDE